MHTTSFKHKYQIGDQVWILNNEPEQSVIESMRFFTDGRIQYVFEANAFWYKSEEDIYDSLMDAQAAYVKEEKLHLKRKIGYAAETVENNSRSLHDMRQQLAALEALGD